MKAKITINKSFIISEVDPRLFGGFIEHMGRAVYEGIYEPDHPEADKDGFRTDVLELIKELDMPVMRYPGGNFLSGYDWEDGIGPREERPTKLDLAWRAVETNQMGTNEFVDWCRKANTEPILSVNLGTRRPENAQNIVEYCNYPGGSYWSELRKEHGYKEPHNVKTWCLGNEMDGPWQIEAKTATEYGRTAREAAKLMKWTDPSIELVVCGSSSPQMPTFAEWEAEVLTHTFWHVDYISIHRYYDNSKNDLPDFLSKPDELNDFIKGVTATCDYIAAKKKSKKRIMLSMDEWNVWYHTWKSDTKIPLWESPRPILQEAYTLEDGLVVGGMLITLLNNADRVKIGCIAQTVNVIAPIMTEKMGPAWAQTIFYPLKYTSKNGRGIVLRQVVESPGYNTKERENVPYLISASVYNPDNGSLTIFAVNRNLEKSLELEVDLGSFENLEVDEWVVMSDDDLKAVNTSKNPENVIPAKASGAVIKDKILAAELQKASWNMIRLTSSG